MTTPLHTRICRALGWPGSIVAARCPVSCLFLFVLLAAIPVGPAQAEHELGLQLSFDQLLDRKQALLNGTRVSIHADLHVRLDWMKDPIAAQYRYSPELQMVYRISGPAFLGEEPSYYLYDGAWYVYEPRSWKIPGIEVRATPRLEDQRQKLQLARRELFAERRKRALGFVGTEGPLQGIEIKVLPVLPGALQTVFGREETNIRVTGRESISFAGESRRVSPFIRNEQGRGQSLFPRLDMDQDLQVKLNGTIGGKVNVIVDHNSSGFGANANRINIWYEGYEDDIIRRIDMGSTNLSIPGSRLVSFAGGTQGLFGIKTDLRIGGLELTLVASKEETESETRSLTPSGSSAIATPISENRYVRDQFYFYSAPDTNSLQLYDFYGLNPGTFDAGTGAFTPGVLIDENQVQGFRIFIDDQNPRTTENRNFLGYAVEGMGSAARGDTVQAWNLFVNHPAGNRARWPQVDPADIENSVRNSPGRWREMGPEEIGYVFLAIGDRKVVLGFFLKFGPLDDDDVLAVTYDDPGVPDASIGSLEDQGVDGLPTVRLRLLRHPDQEASYHEHPTSTYMMRHVYTLGARSITQLEVSLLSQASGKQAPEIPDNIPSTTYLHMFGLDEYDQDNQLVPDGQFDINRVNLWDAENGYLFLPGLRPFSPPDEILLQRLVSADIDTVGIDLAMVFPDVERVTPDLYTLPSSDPNIPSRRYSLLTRVTAGEREIILPQDIIEGSEVVKLDGRELTAGVDYDIEPFAGGRITLKGEALNAITPDSRIEVSYQFRPLFGGGQASLFGASAKYKLGTRGQIASVWLFESRRGLSRRPRLGEEPNRTLVGDVNGSIRFQPRWMTKLMDILPFTNTSAASNLQFNGEIAMSLPNPNTKGSAFIDDLENAANDDEFPLSRRNWYWASMPPAAEEMAIAPDDTLLRVPIFWYNPVGRVRRRDLNPLLDSREGDDGLTVLEIGFNAKYATDVTLPNGKTVSDLWSGVMTSFGTSGLDLTQAKSIEFWLNDARAFEDRRGRIHFDFGSVSEDFIFFPNNPTLGLTGDVNFNREAETAQRFIAQEDDRGFNGRIDGCETYDDGESNGNFPPEGTDCHIPSKINAAQQFPNANGTEGNNRYDTEDINRNGRFDEIESFFRYTMDLNDVTWVQTDVQRDYGNANLGVDANNAWRQYRIDFSAIESQLERITRRGASQPSLRQIRYMRVWFDDPDATDGTFFKNNVQIYGFKFTGNQWLQIGVFDVDSTSVAPAANETYTVGTINNKEDPTYVPPPVEQLLDAGGLQAREQSLRMTFKNLRAGHEMVLQRTLNLGSRAMDITTYRRLKYFVHYSPTMSDSIEFFFRLGTDSLNFYEIAHTAPSGDPWTEISIDMDRLTELRFPEDVPGATFEIININGTLVQQVRASTADALRPSRQLLLTRRGEPSLKSLTRLFIGVRHLVRDPRPDSQNPDDFPVSGDIWFNEVSVDEVDREMGVAQAYSASGKFADVLDVSVGYTVTDPEFRGLRQRLGSGSENVSFSNRYSGDLSRLIPTWGFSLPANYSYQKSRIRPKWFSRGDTRNSEQQMEEQRSESVRQSMGISISKRASRFFLWKPTLDKLRFSYSRSETEARAFTSRDTSVAWTQTLTYDISPRARAFRFWRQHKINLFPTNIKLNVQNQQSFSTRYTVRKVLNLETGAMEDSLTKLSSSPNRQLTWNGSMALRPLPNVTARYSFNESRNYRTAHPDNEAERVKIFKFDFGIPTRRSESFAFDLTPRLFRFGYASSYSDGRISTNDFDGDPLPDTHGLSNRRTRRLSFDLGMHRKIAAWGIFQDKPKESPPPTPGRTGQDDPNHPDGPNSAADAASTPSAADSVQAKPNKSRRPPNPIKFLFRTLGRVDPIRVELTDGLSTSYTGLSGEAQLLYRLGWTVDTGVENGSTPTPVDRNNSVELSTGVPLFGTVKLTTRYARRRTERERRTDAGGIRIYRDPTLETTFPSFQVSLSNLSRFPFFGSKMRRGTLSLGLSQTTTSSSSKVFDEDNVELRETNFRASTRLNASGNWTAQWGGDVATTFSINRSSSENESVGLTTTSVTWRLQSSLRFKIQPQGGLKLPLFGTLRGGMDVSLSANYNRDENRTFNNPNDPTDFIISRRSNAWSLSARGDYTLSRNMSGGMEVSFSRTGQNDRINRTTTLLRLGFNLTFVF